MTRFRFAWSKFLAWSIRQARQSWWVVPLQPVFTVTVLAAGITAALPGTDFSSFHQRLGWFAAHSWLVLGIVSPLMTLLSYALVLKGHGRTRVWGFNLRLGGDLGMFVVLAVFALMHIGDTGSDEDLYVTVGFCGLLVALVLMILRDVWEIMLTEYVAGRIHRGDDG